MTITREEAIKTLKELWRETNDQWYEETYKTAIKALSEQLQGKWEYCEHEIANHVDGYKCSNCGFFIPWDYMHKSVYFIEDYNFCPSCGADMRGENK